MADRASKSSKQEVKELHEELWEKLSLGGKEVPNKPTMEELCKEHGLDLRHSWALCALEKGESVSSHWKKGRCKCTDPPTRCKRCCTNGCCSRKLLLRLDVVLTPPERRSKLRAAQKIRDWIEEENSEMIK